VQKSPDINLQNLGLIPDDGGLYRGFLLSVAGVLAGDKRYAKLQTNRFIGRSAFCS
jgi:hypothetical protein